MMSPMVEVAQTPAASRLLAAYDVGPVIGRGGFSVVRAARDRRTGQDMAIKIIPKAAHAHKPAELRRLRNEIRVLAGMRHPNIMPLICVYETPADLLLVMERAQGGELFDRIVQRGAFTEGDAAVVTRGVLSALAHLHAHGVMHRDVKPENLLLANSFGWEVRLSDFGLVRVLGAGPKGRTGKGRSTVIPGHLTASGASSNASTTSDPAQEEEEAVANAVAVASPPAGALAPLVLAGAAAGDASTNRRALKPQTSSSSSVSVTSSNGGDLSPLTDADDYASSSSTANSSPRLSHAHLGSDDTDSGMTGGDGDNAAAAAATAAVASAAAGSASGGGGGGGCGGG
mmetsp:Transcript_57511/g.108227  ORF Transcript_57511/g.108227 Transcript_57511/m.108227 type:complete len:343 (+) Transcript_57511:217-1245(+)